VRVTHYWDNVQMDSAWAVVMMLGMLAFWTLLVVAIIWAVRSSRSPNVRETRAQPSGAGGVTGNAEHILAHWLALGEIDPDEYRTKLEALRSRSVS